MRADLAGGTLDIYPLYLFLGGGVTVNMAISVTSEATVETRKDKKIQIISEDLGEELTARNIESLQVGKKLDLLCRIVRFYAPSSGVTIRTKNNVPKGSGLGASSSLLIALSHALNKLSDKPFNSEEIINYGANIEAQSIRVPTGKQDYYSATYGGISAIWFDITGARRELLVGSNAIMNELENRTVISFAGEPRFSGASNWHMFRDCVDGEEQTVRNFEQIKSTAVALRKSLMKGNLDVFGKLLDEEWQNRKGLTQGVTNDDIDSLMNTAHQAGAISSKICGAGGGGCMISFCQPGTKENVEKALTAGGADVFDWKISRNGVQVTIE